MFCGFVSTTTTNISFWGSLMENDIKSLLLTIQQTLKNQEQILTNQQKELEIIKDYVIAKSTKHTEEDLETCLQIINNDLYLTTTKIKNHEILGLKYTERHSQKYFLDLLLKKHPELKDVKIGQGNKRYIFKEENEETVKQLIKSKKTTRYANNKDVNNNIKNFLLNYPNNTITTKKLHDILQFDFGIKTQFRRLSILKGLARENIIGADSGIIHINKKGCLHD